MNEEGKKGPSLVWPRTAIQRHYVVLGFLIAATLGFHLWVYFCRWETNLVGLDFRNIIAVGRQFVEHHALPTFRFTGKTYGGPLKSVWMFWPCLLLGYHEWIPPLMTALTATFVGIGCYLAGRLLFSLRAGLLALAFYLALDPTILGYVYRPGFGFDILLTLSLLVAVCAVLWVRGYRRHGKQPGVLFCVAMGTAAGLMWYGHPVGSVTIVTSALFLLISLGLRIFTWRVLVVGMAAFVASLRFWLYHLSFAVARGDGHLFSMKETRNAGILEAVASRKGVMWFTLAPGDHMPMRLFLLAGLLIGFVYVLFRLGAWLYRAKSADWLKYLRNGFPLPAYAYAIVAILCLLAFAVKTQALLVIAHPWSYVIELWFWYMIIAVGVLDRLLTPRHRFLWAAVAILWVVFFATTARTVKPSSASHVRRWEETRDIGHELMAHGFTNVLTSNPRYYSYFSLGPSGLVISERYKPWLYEPSRIVEQSLQPAVISPLTPATLGTGAWQKTVIEDIAIYHDFVEPAAGSVLPSDAVSVLVRERPEGAVLDDNFATFWWERTEDVHDAYEDLVVDLDEPHRIGRLVLYIEWTEADWSFYRYPGKLTVEGLAANGEWVVLAKGAEPDGYFWDGGRLFHAERSRKRFDIRFQPQTVQRLRLIDEHTPNARDERRLSELYVFKVGDDREKPKRDLNAVLAYLESLKPRRVLADRFISAQVTRHMPDVTVWKPFFLRTISFYVANSAAPWPWSPDLEPVLGEPGTVLVVDQSFATRVRALLDREDVVFHSRPVGGWEVFTLDDDQESVEQSMLVWNGFCVGYYPRKAAALDAAREGSKLIEQGDLEAGAEALKRALQIYPRMHEAGRLLESLEGYAEEADALWQRPVDPQAPFDAPVVFADGTLLIGVDIMPRKVKPGEAVTVRYFFRVPADWFSLFKRPYVFAHLEQGDFRIIDDHLLLAQYPHRILRDVVFPETYVTERRVRIPADAPAGSYTLRTGLHRSGERVEVKRAGEDVTVDYDDCKVSIVDCLTVR